eukprot:CAMPEP_0171085664 /NCGR_PEP_ID=MMETSP0766_2-20121228/19073_1 /TAXON_ID=439317 /ORGANISM="Gambierdiscus australes, Strain CAWD 149" /LENGTH=48 /DNA_ID= /DNA_START= /DNA_END= /DNA_ORIENTATION=
MTSACVHPVASGGCSATHRNTDQLAQPELLGMDGRPGYGLMAEKRAAA